MLKCKSVNRKGDSNGKGTVEPKHATGHPVFRCWNTPGSLRLGEDAERGGLLAWTLAQAQAPVNGDSFESTGSLGSALARRCDLTGRNCQSQVLPPNSLGSVGWPQTFRIFLQQIWTFHQFWSHFFILRPPKCFHRSVSLPEPLWNAGALWWSRSPWRLRADEALPPIFEPSF